MELIDIPEFTTIHKQYNEVVASVIQTTTRTGIKLGPTESKTPRTSFHSHSAIQNTKTTVNWYDQLCELDWNRSVQAMLKMAFSVYGIMRESRSVLINSRVSRAISILIQLIHEPSARTINGFHELMESQWIGDLFLEPLTNTEDNKPTDSEAPLLLILFLNCIQQLLIRNLSAFEFNEDFLVMLIDEYSLCR